jgi:hypothetical protein
LVRLAEGKVITFTTINPSSRNVTISTPAASGEVIIITSLSQSSINNAADFGYVMLFCNGTRWHALGDGSFA